MFMRYLLHWAERFMMTQLSCMRSRQCRRFSNSVERDLDRVSYVGMIGSLVVNVTAKDRAWRVVEADK